MADRVAPGVDLLRFEVTQGGRVTAAVGGAGVPVVFEAGSPGNSGTWLNVAPLVRSLAQTIAYNRLGYEPSDPVEWPRPMTETVADLLAVIESAASAPIVLVAHSMGGIIARLALHSAPQLFRAVVLVDTTPVASLPYLVRLGEETGNQLDEFEVPPLVDLCRDLAEPGALGDLPVCVISAGRIELPDELPHWYRAHFTDPACRAELTTLSTRTRLVELPGCTHNLAHEDPTAVASAIHWAVDQVSDWSDKATR